AARQSLLKIAARDPEEVRSRLILSQILLQHDREEEAEKWLREVLKLDPKQFESWRNLAKVLRNQNRPAEARDVCRQGRQHFPDDPDLLRIQGLALLELNEPAAAEDCLARFLELQSAKPPTSEEDHERVAFVRYQLDQLRGQGAGVRSQEPGISMQNDDSSF